MLADISELNLNLPPKKSLLGLTNEVGLTKEVDFSDLKGKDIVVDEISALKPNNKTQLGIIIREISQAPCVNHHPPQKLPKSIKIKFAEKI